MPGTRATPVKVSLAYTEDSEWRNRSEFFSGRAAIIEFLTRKWAKEIGYKLIKEVWAFEGNHIAARFCYEFHDDAGVWYRAYGNEQWEFAENGLMARRQASINDVKIAAGERKFTWEGDRRPDDFPGAERAGAVGSSDQRAARRSASIRGRAIFTTAR